MSEHFGYSLIDKIVGHMDVPVWEDKGNGPRPIVSGKPPRDKEGAELVESGTFTVDIGEARKKVQSEREKFIMEKAVRWCVDISPIA